MAIAEALHIVRAGMAAGWPPGQADSDARSAHDRKLIYFASLEAVDRVAVVLATTIKARSPRFDQVRFLRLIGVRR